MTGWRIGFAGGPVELIKGMAKIQSQSTSNPSSISPHAAIAALDGPAGFHRRAARGVSERRDLVVGMLNEADGIECATPEGASTSIRADAGMIGRATPGGETLANDEDVARYLLEAEGVAVVFGAAFGLEPYFRISYATSTEALTEACSRIQRAAAALS